MFELFTRLLHKSMIRTALSVDSGGEYEAHGSSHYPSYDGLPWSGGEFDAHDYAWFITCNGLLW